VGLIDDYGYSVAAIGVAGPCERKPRALGPWLAVLSEGAAEVARELGLQVSLTVKASRPLTAHPHPGLQRLMSPGTRNIRE
jgi:hypothetical protein